MASYRTPETAFAGLHGYSYGLHYLDFEVIALRTWEVPTLLSGVGGRSEQVAGASDMLQEDGGGQIAQLMLEWMAG